MQTKLPCRADRGDRNHLKQREWVMILRYTAGSTHILGPCAPYARLKIHRNSSRRSVFPSPVDEAKGQLEMNRVWMHEYVGYRGVCSQTPAHQPVSWMACPYLLSLQVGRHCCIVWLFSRTAPLFLHTATMCQNEFGSFLFAIARLLFSCTYIRGIIL